MVSARPTLPLGALSAAFNGKQTHDSQNSYTFVSDDQEMSDPWRQSAEWKLACRVASSKGFIKSDLLQRFLLHVCALQLAGRGAEISEQRIGEQIFRRAAGYDPGEDNIVRGYARTLRRRLDAYFEREGADEALRIHIPRGGYVPIFEERSMVTVQEAASEPPALPVEDAAPLAAQQPRTLPLLMAGALIGAALMLAAVLGWQHWHATPRTSGIHPLWATLFDARHNTLIVPADSGLGVLQNLSHRVVHVDAYASGRYLSELSAPSGMDAANFGDLSQQRYTSIVSLHLVATLTRLPEYDAARTQIRYARNVSTEDLKNVNAILIGSKHSNPWVELYEGRTNFRFEYSTNVDDSQIENLHPQHGEQSIYRNGSAEQKTYGTITYLNGMGGGHVLIVQGLNMAATQAAADVLLSESAMTPVLRSAQRPDGSLRDLELLIETTSVGAAAPDARIVATRIYDR